MVVQHSAMRKLRVTKSGFIYIIFSIITLSYGLYFGELFASICASGLIVYLLISLIGIIITSFFWKQFDLDIEQKNQNINIKLTNKKGSFPHLLPSINAFFNFIFFTEAGNALSRKLHLETKLNSINSSIQFPNEKRGFFFINNEYIELNDIANFFSFKIHITKKHINEIIIPPKQKETKPLKLSKINKKNSEHKNIIRRNDELYDTRPYFPGDDTRKINWKLYAHTQELNIRQGDFSPPPEDFFTIFITEPVIQKKDTFIIKSFDSFINSINSIAKDIHNNKNTLEVISYNSTKNEITRNLILSDEKNGIEKINTSLAIPQVQILKSKKAYIKQKQLSNQNIRKIIKNFNNCVLCFFMPISFFMDYNKYYIGKNKNNLIMCFGPIQNEKNKSSFIKRFLFENRIDRNNEKKLKILNNKIKNLKNSVNKEGYNAYEI